MFDGLASHSCRVSRQSLKKYPITKAMKVWHVIRMPLDGSGVGADGGVDGGVDEPSASSSSVATSLHVFVVGRRKNGRPIFAAPNTVSNNACIVELIYATVALRHVHGERRADRDAKPFWVQGSGRGMGAPPTINSSDLGARTFA